MMLLVFVPGFNVLLAAVAMMVVGLWGKDAREPGRTNRRRAASWGLTLLLVEICLLVIQIVVNSIVAHYRGWVPFNPWGAPIMVALAMVVVHVVVCVVQGVRSYRGRAVRFGGILFFR